MKLPYLIVSIALVIQVSLAAPLADTQDGDLLVEEFEDFMKFMKNTLTLSETIVQYTLQHMPKTAAYNEYRQTLKTYLNDYDEFKTKVGNCSHKRFAIFLKLANMYTSLLVSEHEEAKEILKLMDASGIGKNQKSFDEWKDKYDPQPFKQLEERYSNDDIRFKSIYDEVC